LLLMLSWIPRRVRSLRRVSVLTHIGTARHNQLDGKHLDDLAEEVESLCRTSLIRVCHGEFFLFIT
jgi:hypothetical protein